MAKSNTIEPKNEELVSWMAVDTQNDVYSIVAATPEEALKNLKDISGITYDLTESWIKFFYCKEVKFKLMMVEVE